MKSIMIKDVMIPISDYMTIKEEDTLFDVFQMLEKTRRNPQSMHTEMQLL